MAGAVIGRVAPEGHPVSVEFIVGVGALHSELALVYAGLVRLMRQAEAAGEEYLAVAILEALGCLHGSLLVPSP